MNPFRWYWPRCDDDVCRIERNLRVATINLGVAAFNLLIYAILKLT